MCHIQALQNFSKEFTMSLALAKMQKLLHVYILFHLYTAEEL